MKKIKLFRDKSGVNFNNVHLIIHIKTKGLQFVDFTSVIYLNKKIFNYIVCGDGWDILRIYEYKSSNRKIYFSSKILINKLSNKIINQVIMHAKISKKY